MGSWNGWESQLLVAAGLPDDKDSRYWLDLWHDHANSNCAANPIDISYPEPNAKRCANLPGGRNAKAYVSHGSAAKAFSNQIHSGAFPHIVSVINGTLQGTTANQQALLTELLRWGSADFAAYLSDTYGVPLPGTDVGGTTHFHQGWSDLRRSVNKRYPNTLADTKKLTDAALRKLAHARKVRI